jgi:UDP-N-acetylmuramate--alanine ligase
VTGLNNIRNVYFLGIGGIGMSALARYFHATGRGVAGYDRTPTPLTRQLSAEGIAVHYSDDPLLVPVSFRSAGDTLVVLTPAVPADHAELAWFRKNGFGIHKRSEILGLIARHKKTIAVAGTHGKTTVSTMIAHIMSQSESGCSAFLGGISKNFNSNLVLNMESDWLVAEADEFDRSFLQLQPYAAIVTSMDPDHLDIYGNAESMREAFSQFITQINRQGILLMKKGLPVNRSIAPEHIYSYALNEEADFRAENIRLENRKYFFDLSGPGIAIRDISLIHPGKVNVENAVAASSMAALLGTGNDVIRKALETFSGIQRRFDYHINTNTKVYIDDYAHHPKELEATITSVRELYPGKKITGIFQPHLYSRTRDLADDFAKSLGLLDQLILLDIYPARELPIEGVNAGLIFNKVRLAEKIMCSRDQLLNRLGEMDIQVLITLGAGDIDTLVDPIKKMYS